MAYMSKRGRRPMELASKAAHSHMINDPVVAEFLDHCDFPKNSTDIELSEHVMLPFAPVSNNPIKHIIAVDGGYSVVPVRKEFPSATVCFFQFGALTFSISDLETLDHQPFIDPEDIAKLKNVQRLKLVLPLQNVSLNSEATLTHSVRKALYDFFMQVHDGETLMETLNWFVFKLYRGQGTSDWNLATCPHCGFSNIPLDREAMTKHYLFSCNKCGGELYLTDVFRLHEAVDDELGAGGIPGYVTTTIEQILLVHLIRIILKTKPNLLNEILFIKDGPLAYFGQTANMHKPMRQLVKFLLKKHNLYLAGLEKSGPFVEHADEIGTKLDDGTILIIDNDYIYRYILPGKADPGNPYGRTTYYSGKLIFKTTGANLYVVSLPTTRVLANPQQQDFPNLMPILTNLEKLRCDMYDSALVPVALVNRLVSLANHPSSKILQKFAIGHINS